MLTNFFECNQTTSGDDNELVFVVKVIAKNFEATKEFSSTAPNSRIFRKF